jgi:hypothetical protein
LSKLDGEHMKENDVEELPPELVAVRDAAVASAYGEGSLPKGADELFNWLFWQANAMDLDDPCFSLDRLDLDDEEARAGLELADDEQLSDQQRLEYARGQIERIWRNDDINFAHAYRIEGQDGRFTYLCGTSWSAGQGGPETDCDGTYPSKEAYLRRLEEGGMSNETAETISIDTVLKNWRR